MPSPRILISIVLLLVATAPATAQVLGPSADPTAKISVRGIVSSVDHAQRTLSLGENLFHVPPDVEQLDAITPGLSVMIEFDEVQGRRQVTSLEIVRKE